MPDSALAHHGSIFARARALLESGADAGQLSEAQRVDLAVALRHAQEGFEGPVQGVEDLCGRLAALDVAWRVNLTTTPLTRRVN